MAANPPAPVPAPAEAPVPLPRFEAVFDGGRLLGGIYIATFVIVALLVVIPLVALIIGSLRDAAPGLPGQWTLKNWAGLLSPGIVSTFTKTIVIGVAASVFSAIVGTA